MTVTKKSRKSKKNPTITQMKSSVDFTSIDTLIERIEELETLEANDTTAADYELLFEDSDLLTSSFKSLLSLMDPSIQELTDDLENGFDSSFEKMDENVMEIMTEFFREGLVDEEDFEDFFVEDLEESEDEEDCEEESEEDCEEGCEEESEEEENIESELDRNVISSTKSSKVMNSKMTKSSNNEKTKNMRELEMLMAKVDSESDFEEDDDEDEEDEEEEENIIDEDDEENEEKKDMFAEDVQQQRLSSFEKSQKALKDQISLLESENILSQKPWSLRGEINARQRPSDSLLEEAVDFDNLARPTPQITEERSEEIEDIIRRRISESAWDDVVRKDGRDLTLLNGMKETGKGPRALLEDVATAGPKKSLSQVYEDDLSTKLSGGTSPADQETLQKQQELTAAFAKICRHIDGLSGNRFAPKVYVQSDFQIKTLNSGASGSRKK